MGRRSSEAHALESTLFRSRKIEAREPVPVVCTLCSGFGELHFHGTDETETCAVCGGLGFDLEY